MHFQCSKLFRYLVFQCKHTYPKLSCSGMSKGVGPVVLDCFNQMRRVWYEENWTIFFIAVGIYCLVHRTFITIQPHHTVELAIGGSTITGKGDHFEMSSFQPSHAAPHWEYNWSPDIEDYVNCAYENLRSDGSPRTMNVRDVRSACRT